MAHGCHLPRRAGPVLGALVHLWETGGARGGDRRPVRARVVRYRVTRRFCDGALGTQDCERAAPCGLTRRERHPNDYTCRSGRSCQGEEVTHRAACGTERTHHRLGQRQRPGSRIYRGVTSMAGQRASAEHARARRLPPFLDGGPPASASLELAMVDPAKHAHRCQSRRGSFTHRIDISDALAMTASTYASGHAFDRRTSRTLGPSQLSRALSAASTTTTAMHAWAPKRLRVDGGLKRESDHAADPAGVIVDVGRQRKSGPCWRRTPPSRRWWSPARTPRQLR